MRLGRENDVFHWVDFFWYFYTLLFYVICRLLRHDRTNKISSCLKHQVAVEVFHQHLNWIFHLWFQKINPSKYFALLPPAKQRYTHQISWKLHLCRKCNKLYTAELKIFILQMFFKNTNSIFKHQQLTNKYREIQ